MKQKFQLGAFSAVINRLAVVLVLLSIVACSSTTLVSRWSDVHYKGPQFSNVLVIGIINDDIKRRYYEDEMVKIIRAKGGQAVTSYNFIHDLGTVDDKSKIIAIVKQTGVDSVLITSLEGVDKEQRVVPARVDYVPAMGYSGYRGYGRSGYYGYYRSSYQAVYHPAYAVTDTIVRLETRLYEAVTEEMVWAGVTKSENPDSIDEIIKETADVIGSDMRQHGLIK
jgi:hypothetical protein